MGAGNVQPTLPAWSGGFATIADLNRLSYGVSFLIDNSVRPAWNLFMHGSTQSIGAAAWTTLALDHTAYDSDGVQSYPNAIIVTQGFYALTANVSGQANANTTDMYTVAFKMTAGNNNPHMALNAVLWFGFKANRFSSTAQAAADNAISISDITPVCQYPGDTLAVQVFFSAAHTADYNHNTSYIQGRFAANFTGSWVRSEIGQYGGLYGSVYGATY